MANLQTANLAGIQDQSVLQALRVMQSNIDALNKSMPDSADSDLKAIRSDIKSIRLELATLNTNGTSGAGAPLDDLTVKNLTITDLAYVHLKKGKHTRDAAATDWDATVIPEIEWADNPKKELVKWIIDNYWTLDDALNNALISKPYGTPPRGGVRAILDALYTGWYAHDKDLIAIWEGTGITGASGHRDLHFWNSYTVPSTGMPYGVDSMDRAFRGLQQQFDTIGSAGLTTQGNITVLGNSTANHFEGNTLTLNSTASFNGAIFVDIPAGEYHYASDGTSIGWGPIENKNLVSWITQNYYALEDAIKGLRLNANIVKTLPTGAAYSAVGSASVGASVKTADYIYWVYNECASAVNSVRTGVGIDNTNPSNLYFWNTKVVSGAPYGKDNVNRAVNALQDQIDGIGTYQNAYINGTGLSWAFPLDLHFFSTKLGAGYTVNSAINALQDQIDSIGARMVAHGI